jgi:hypothetical protein
VHDTGPVFVAVALGTGTLALADAEGVLAAEAVPPLSLPTNVVAAKMPPATTTTATPAPMKVFRLALEDCSAAARCFCRSLCSRASSLLRSSSPLTGCLLHLCRHINSAHATGL